MGCLVRGSLYINRTKSLNGQLSEISPCNLPSTYTAVTKFTMQQVNEAKLNEEISCHAHQLKTWVRIGIYKKI